MRAIEFIADAKDGVIRIPKKYKDQLDKKFRVIILQSDLVSKTKKITKKRTFNAVNITTIT